MRTSLPISSLSAGETRTPFGAQALFSIRVSCCSILRSLKSSVSTTSISRVGSLLSTAKDEHYHSIPTKISTLVESLSTESPYNPACPTVRWGLNSHEFPPPLPSQDPQPKPSSISRSFYWTPNSVARIVLHSFYAEKLRLC